MKKSLNSFLLVLMLVLVPVISQAKGTTSGPARQVKPEEAIEFKNRQLLVVKTGETEFDEIVQLMISNYWNLQQSVQYVSTDELNTIITDNPEKYGVLTVNKIELKEYSNYITMRNRYLRFSIWFAENLNKRRALYYQNVLYNNISVKEITKTRVFTKDKNEYSFDLTKTEVLFAIGMIQNHIKARIEGKQRITVNYEALENTGKLQNKILLIAESDLNDDLKEKDLSEYYPYSYEIVTKQEIEDKFLAKDSKYAYVEIIPLGYVQAINSMNVIDCENGELLSFGEQYNGAFDRYTNNVGKGHLKAFAKNSNRAID